MNINFGCANHFKQDCDKAFGLLSTIFEAHVKTYRVETDIDNVIPIFEAWAKHEHETHPDGRRYIFKNSIPKPKDSFKWNWFTPEDCSHFEGQYAWSISRKASRTKIVDGYVRPYAFYRA